VAERMARIFIISLLIRRGSLRITGLVPSQVGHDEKNGRNH